jgi:molybdopterin molybdotransferase
MLGQFETTIVGEPMLDIEDAVDLLLKGISPLVDDIATVAIRDAIGRVTSDDIRATVDVPPFANSAMDGYAVCSTDTIFQTDSPAALTIAGTSFAGNPFEGPLPENASIRIFTGAEMPQRADAVIIQEEATSEAGAVRFETLPLAGQNVRSRGHDVLADEVMFTAGRRLSAFDIAWLSACGHPQVSVLRRPRVAVFSTGDELIEPGNTLRPGQIFDSNRLVLELLMNSNEVEVLDLGIIKDDESSIIKALKAAQNDADLVLTSGGVSVGDADYVRTAIEKTGAIDFWKLKLKPGKPLAFGRTGGVPFFGLPGNPVSTIVTFLLIVKPALEKLAGTVPKPLLKIPASLGSPIAHKPGRAEFQRGELIDKGGELTVTPTGDQSSNRLSTFRDANCLIWIPVDAGNLERGSVVKVLPFGGLIGS